MPDDNVTSFPPTKPTIADIVNDGIKTGQTPNAIFATIGTLYPKKKMGEIMAAFEAEIDRQKTEYAKSTIELERFKEIFALIESIRAELGDEDMASDQALWIAAERGNEQATLFWYDLATAVALDPDWGVGEDGVAIHTEDATYNSPEKLVAAYRAGRLDDPRPIDHVVGEICLRACRICGLDPDVVDQDAAARGRVAEVSSRITETHPRRTEIKDFFVEQGVREEYRQQCRERGIPVIEDEEPRHGN
jgi:hypothetical protein